MVKGTPSKGKHANRKTHIPCRRCGKKSYNVREKYCASCGYGRTTRLRSYSWAKTH